MPAPSFAFGGLRLCPFALGCLLWTCLTGREPYQGTDVQVALAHQTAPIPQLPGTGELVDLGEREHRPTPTPTGLRDSLLAMAVTGCRQGDLEEAALVDGAKHRANPHGLSRN